jgi:hypothetical protein
MYVYNADETAFTTFYFKNPEKWYGETEHRRFGQFQVRRDEPLQQLSEVSALLTAVHLLWWRTERKETSNVGHCQDSLAFNSQSTYVSKEHVIKI